MSTEVILALLLGFFGGFVFAVLFVLAFISKMVKRATIIKTGKEED